MPSYEVLRLWTAGANASMEHSMARWHVVAATLLLACSYCAAQTVGISSSPEFMSTLVPEQFNIDFGKYIPKMNITDPSVLPCERPKPYKYPTRLKASSFNATKKSDSDAVVWTLKHDPIKNVTPNMVTWMWENFNKNVTDPRDGKKYNMYLMMHPTDHAYVKWNKEKLVVSKLTEPANGTQWLLGEVPGSGCVHTSNTTIRCPTRPFNGYTCTTDVTELNKRPTMNLTMYNAEFRKSGPGPRVLRLRYFFNIKDTGIVTQDLWAPFVEFRHEMTNSRDGLMVLTTFTTGWDTSLAKVVNGPYLEPVWTAGTAGNWQQTTLYYAVHTMQEFAVLPQWLPKVYKAEKGKI